MTRAWRAQRGLDTTLAWRLLGRAGDVCPLRLVVLLSVASFPSCRRPRRTSRRPRRTASPSAESSRSRPRIARRRRTTRAASSVPGLLWRFGTSKGGWGFHWGLNWYAVKLERPIGGTAIELGELHVRPVMAGYGYTHLIRRYCDHRRRARRLRASARSTSAIRRSPRTSARSACPRRKRTRRNTLVAQARDRRVVRREQEGVRQRQRRLHDRQARRHHRNDRRHRSPQGARRSVHPQGRRRLFDLLIAAADRGIFAAAAGLKKA